MIASFKIVLAPAPRREAISARAKDEAALIHGWGATEVPLTFEDLQRLPEIALPNPNLANLIIDDSNLIL